MDRDDENLEQLAQAVADGETMNWEHQPLPKRVESSAQALQIIARIRDASLAIESSQTPKPTKPPPLPASSLEITEPLPEVAGGRWLHLEFRELLGRGASGNVYRAYDSGLDQDVALKLFVSGQIDPTALTEAAKLARVRHPNVLTVYGAQEDRGQAGIWTELIHGRTLETLLQEQGRFGAEEARQIGLTLSRALAAVHEAGLVHGDVKALNVMREEGGRIVLLDFSAARPRDPAADDESSALKGTLFYLAPEQFRGVRQTVASDVYALGVLLFRLLTGRYPVEGRTFGELREKHSAGERLRLRDLHPTLPLELIRTIEKAVAPNPSDRFQSMAEVEDALSPGSTTTEPPPRTAPGARPPLAWEKLLLGVSILLLVVLGARFLVDRMTYRAEATVLRYSLSGDLPLEEGGILRPGDKVSVQVEASRSSYVYVLNQDALGEAFLLFPLPGLDTTNPITANTTHQLPGTVQGTPYYWDVTSAGGTETLLILSSPEPVDELEAMVAALGPDARRNPVPLQTSVVENLRGLGGMSPGDSTELHWPTLFREGRSGRDLKVWELRYRNPES